jgi:hypothetical protein
VLGVKTWVPPWSWTGVPSAMLAISHLASARVTRTQPWLAGWFGTEFEPWIA